MIFSPIFVFLNIYIPNKHILCYLKRKLSHLNKTWKLDNFFFFLNFISLNKTIYLIQSLYPWKLFISFQKSISFESKILYYLWKWVFTSSVWFPFQTKSQTAAQTTQTEWLLDANKVAWLGKQRKQTKKG